MIRIATLSGITALLLAGSAFASTVRYVDDDAPPGGNGRSWAAAYNDLQTALADELADEIRIAAGTYTPGEKRTDTFLIPSGMTLRGGFDGETILSGDLAGDDPVLDENAYHVVTVDGTCRLERLTIRAGNANGDQFANEAQGAGVLAIDAVVRLRQCHLLDNQSKYGGGLYIVGGGAFASNCAFSGDRGNVTSASGGGIYCEDGWLILERCDIDDNFKENGGGIAMWNSHLIGNRCSFTSNSAEPGGAVLASDSTVLLDRCEFIANESRLSVLGGGAALSASERSNVVVTRSLFEANVGLGGFAASVAAAEGQSRVLLLGCDLIDNTEPLKVTDETSFVLGAHQ